MRVTERVHFMIRDRDWGESKKWGRPPDKDKENKNKHWMGSGWMGIKKTMTAENGIEWGRPPERTREIDLIYRVNRLVFSLLEVKRKERSDVALWTWNTWTDTGDRLHKKRATMKQRWEWTGNMDKWRLSDGTSENLKVAVAKNVAHTRKRTE